MAQKNFINKRIKLRSLNFKLSSISLHHAKMGPLGEHTSPNFSSLPKCQSLTLPALCLYIYIYVCGTAHFHLRAELSWTLRIIWYVFFFPVDCGVCPKKGTEDPRPRVNCFSPHRLDSTPDNSSFGLPA